MKIIRQIFLLLAFYLLGELAQTLIGLAFPGIFVPGTVLGLFFLLAALALKWLPLSHIESVGTFLTQNMAFFFIPAAVSVLDYWNLLAEHAWQILLVILASLLAGFFAVAGSVRLVLRWQAARRAKRGNDHA